jgi:hypothetical protein
VHLAVRAGHRFGIGLNLSVWVRDSGLKWHLARRTGQRWAAGPEENLVQFQLVPPLPRSARWIEVVAAGRSAQVRAKVPLRWENRDA